MKSVNLLIIVLSNHLWVRDLFALGTHLSKYFSNDCFALILSSEYSINNWREANIIIFSKFKGNLLCPTITIWAIFIIHFIYIGIFQGIFKKYLCNFDIIVDAILLFTVESIAILITLSNNRNNYKFVTISLIISYVNIPLILFSIFINIFTLFIKNTAVDKFLKPQEEWPYITGEPWQGLLLIILKLIEASPVIILIIRKWKYESPVGTINPETIEQGKILDKDKVDDEDDILE